MKIEIFSNITIAYMRRFGAYGPKNKELMETFKAYLKTHDLLNEETVILGLALDDPQVTPVSALRYDVGLILKDSKIDGLEVRNIADGQYAIFEIPHTEKDMQLFWANIWQTTEALSIDRERPIIERYAAHKINHHLCEMCIPIIALDECQKM
jgi:DNA gyrase inhibitor GyrI